ncbi:MAG: methanogenesis marker protein Mmp4/MtxX [Methanocorpusculum sp.]|nr:methanogenesis marker protein Mmp4/MtxX [Methanocorpusculum sp.]
MRIGIGCGADIRKVAASAAAAARSDVTVICYCLPGASAGVSVPADVEFAESSEPWRALVDDLFSQKIDGAVRGSLPANETLRYLKSVYGVSRLERIALLETASHQKFFFAPVGVDEGWTVEEKISFINDGRRLARAFGISERTSVLCGGRRGDVGRHPVVDKTIADAKAAADATDAVFGEILIEEAVRDCGVIIAPDGISGNLVFRTLVFLGGGEGHGAPVVNIPAVFVDSSRASAGYEGILFLTISLVKNNFL